MAMVVVSDFIDVWTARMNVPPVVIVTASSATETAMFITLQLQYSRISVYACVES